MSTTFTPTQRRNPMSEGTKKILLFILSFFIPPIVVWIRRDWKWALFNFLIIPLLVAIVFNPLGALPSILHALYTVQVDKK